MNLRFEFQELSLLSQDGFNLRLEANGYAVIEYKENGGWQIDEIWLEGTRLTKTRYEYERRNIEVFDGIAALISQAIRSQYSSDIQDRIRDELNEHGISIPDPNREHLEVSTS